MTFIALHRTRFDLGAGASIDIEAVLGTGRPITTPWEFAPNLMAAEEEIEVTLVSSGGILPMCWRESGHLFERFQLREDTDYFIDVSLPLTLNEAVERSRSSAHWPFDARLSTVFKRDPSRRWKEANTNDRCNTIVTGQLRLRSHAGVIDLRTEFGSSLLVEIACRKLGYFEEFKELLDSLAEKAAGLLLSFDSPVSLSFDLTNDLSKNNSALYFLMRYVMSDLKLPLAAEEIIAYPHSHLVERLAVVPVEELEDADASLIADGIEISEMVKGGPLARHFGGYSPTTLPQREIFETLNTPENRFAKAFLEHCSVIARHLESRMAARGRRASEREAHSWTTILDTALQHGMWHTVGNLSHIPANSQVLARRRGYKELFHFDLALRMSLSLSWPQGDELSDGLSGDVRPVNQIYEYWCFFMLREALLGICSETSGGNFISLSKDSLRVELAKGRKSECRFNFISAGGQEINVSLFYNRRFLRSKTPRTDWSGSYTASFDPDFSIVASPTSNRSLKHWLHFDAKYRLERKQAEDIFAATDETDETDEPIQGKADEPKIDEYEVELTRIHKQEDLYKMHTYRDGILSTRGAYVLFPGDGVGGRPSGPRPNLFVRHPTALGGGSSHRIPSVGAFDLAPGGGPEQLAAVQALISAALEVAAAGVPYQEEQANF